MAREKGEECGRSYPSQGSIRPIVSAGRAMSVAEKAIADRSCMLFLNEAAGRPSIAISFALLTEGTAQH